MTGLLGYQSAWTDPATGKDLMGARWYNPAAGDFTTADTVPQSPDPDPAAGNPFAYAADNPLDLADPTGHYIVPSGTAISDGTTARVGTTSVTSSSNYVADMAAAPVIRAAGRQGRHPRRQDQRRQGGRRAGHLPAKRRRRESQG